MRLQLAVYFLALSFMLAVTAKVPAGEPTFTTIDAPGAIYTEAVDINDFGQIVGRYYDGNACTIPCFSADFHNHGYLLSHGSFTSFDIPGSDLTGAAGINPTGDIVGIYHLAGAPAGEIHGYLLRGGPGGDFTSIDFPGSISTTAWKINANGKIVGRYTDANGTSHVFLLSGGPGGDFTSIDFPGAANTAPAAIPIVGINARNDIVSTYCGSPCFPTAHGFLLSGGEFTPVDFPSAVITVAWGINFGRDIVGSYASSLTCCNTSSKGHGFLRSSGEGN